MMKLVREGEKISPRIVIKDGNRFEGDKKIFLKCTDDMFAPSAEDLTHAALLCGRNDANRPGYRYGADYMKKFIDLNFRENSTLWQRSCKWSILNELRSDARTIAKSRMASGKLSLIQQEQLQLQNRFTN